MPLNTEFPAWLQAQYAPQAQSTWMLQALQQGMERERMRQTLPLEIQQAQLQQRATQLGIEHQGMVNEASGIELENFKGDQDMLNDAIKQAAATPGGAMAVPTPAFRSHQAMNLWLDRVKTDADTSAGIAYKQRVIEQTKRAQAVMGVPGTPVLRPGPDGTYDEAQLQQAEQIATVYQAQQQEALARVKAMHDPLMFRAQRLGELQDQLDASQARVAATGQQAALQAGLGAAQAAGFATPAPNATAVDVAEEARLQNRLRTEMEELRTPDAAHAPAELVVENYLGTTGLRNTKTGAWHPLDKGMSEREFFDKHLGQVLQNVKPDKAGATTRSLFEEYRKLEGRPTAMPGVNPPQMSAPAPAGKFVAGKTYVDKNGNRAVYQADGTWKQIP